MPVTVVIYLQVFKTAIYLKIYMYNVNIALFREYQVNLLKRKW